MPADPEITPEALKLYLDGMESVRAGPLVAVARPRGTGTFARPEPAWWQGRGVPFSWRRQGSMPLPNPRPRPLSLSVAVEGYVEKWHRQPA
jgi:hypothetical protein